MIGGVFLINQKGDVVLSRFYRDNASRRAADAFRMEVIAAKEAGTKPPIQSIDGSTFLYTRHLNMYMVAVTRANVNPALAFEYLFQLNRIFKAYLGHDYTEDQIRNNFTLIYELLEETMDFGYPQNCAIDVLKMYVNLGSIIPRENILSGSTAPPQLTAQITGAIDWRRDGLRYKKNEVFIDVMENVNLLMSTDGTILRNDVSGQVLLKTMLSGMPECKFGLNDKLVTEREASTTRRVPSGQKRTLKSVEIEDCTFHRCVRLGKFDADRTITFIPPDGQFELMRYRINNSINLPFKIIPAIQEEGKTRMTINLKLVSNFNNRLHATNVLVKIPTPHNTARCKLQASVGRCKFEPEQKAVIWRIRKFVGGNEEFLTGEVELVKSTRDKAWSRPPLELEFAVPMFTSSGLHVRFLKVFEKSSYDAGKWVRYLTRAGQYQIRI